MLSAGKYKGKIIHHKIIKSKDGAIIFLCEAVLNQKQENKEYGSIPEESVSGFISLIKKDGTVNHRQVENLSQAFDWDGKSLKNLQDGDYSEKELNITVEVETREDKPVATISWINLPGDGAFAKTSSKKIEEFDDIFSKALSADKPSEKKDGKKDW
jgi:hypothetical protein